MSTSAYFRLVRPREGESLGTEIKIILARRYLDHDGSLSGDFILDVSDLGYLSGLLDGGIKDAKKLIDAINNSEEVEVYLEN